MGILTGAGRVGRLHYFVVGTALSLASLIGYYLSIDVDEHTREVSISPLFIVVGIVTMWFSATNVLRRLHDCGHSGWMLLLSLVPLIGVLLWVYLLFVPGDPVRNLYGPPPGQREPASVDAHRQRMELLAAVAGEAYKARKNAAYLNEDGSYNMDWMSADGSAGDEPRPDPPTRRAPDPAMASVGEVAGSVSWSGPPPAGEGQPITAAELATLPPPPMPGPGPDGDHGPARS